MRHVLPLLLVLWATAAAAAGERPTRADLQRALALQERSVVKVKGSRGEGPGVIVGTEGQVLTSVRHVELEAAQVEFERRVLPTTVLLADAALKVAVVAAPAGTYPAVPVQQVAAGALEGQWLIGVEPGPGRRQTPATAQARAAPAPFIDVDLVLPPGSPLFDARGRLVAVSVQRQGRGCRALPLEVVRQRLAPRVASP
jgi:hypothetical protein